MQSCSWRFIGAQVVLPSSTASLSQPSNAPSRLSPCAGKVVVQVSAGKTRTACVTSEGDIFVWEAAAAAPSAAAAGAAQRIAAGPVSSRASLEAVSGPGSSLLPSGAAGGSGNYHSEVANTVSAGDGRFADEKAGAAGPSGGGGDEWVVPVRVRGVKRVGQVSPFLRLAQHWTCRFPLIWKGSSSCRIQLRRR